MSDMYGAIRSNVFKVKDVEAFKAWFTASVTFSDGVQLWTNYGDDKVAFGGMCQYPNAYPQVPAHHAEDEIDSDLEQEDWDLQAFATEVRKHLADGEEFRVLAAGSERLRYVSATHLIVSASKAEFHSYDEGN